MAKLSIDRLVLLNTAGYRIRKCYANQKGKRWLNKIMQRATCPGNVALMVSQKGPERTIGKRFMESLEIQKFGGHEHHHETAIGIHRHESASRKAGLVIENRKGHW